jgi:hypothetical protein
MTSPQSAAELAEVGSTASLYPAAFTRRSSCPPLVSWADRSMSASADWRSPALLASARCDRPLPLLATRTNCAVDTST